VYGQRWRIEDAFNAVKRLLGLAYFWVGSVNGVELQVWATWLLYAVLIDLTDAVAEVLERPFDALSLETVYRSLYFFTGAYQRGGGDRSRRLLGRQSRALRHPQTQTQRQIRLSSSPSRLDFRCRTLTWNQCA